MKKIQQLYKSQLFKITSLNSVSVVVKVVVGLINSKMIAIYVGPSGMGLLGNLRDFMNSLESVAMLGFKNGVVKYLSENKHPSHETSKIITTFLISTLFVTLLLSVLLFLGATQINEFVFGNANNYVLIVKMIAFALPWYVFSLAFSVILNGLQKFKKIIYLNIIGNAIVLVFTIWLVYTYQTFGALAAAILAPSLLFFMALYYLHKEISFFKYINFQFFDAKILLKLAPYSIMLLVSALLSSFIFIEIRKEVIVALGGQYAGYWEAIGRVSTYTLMFISTLLAVYYYPKLAAAKSIRVSSLILWNYYTWILTSFGVGLFILYLFRKQIVAVLFTIDFEFVETLFFWQFIGDLLKAAALILGYQLLAKKMTIYFIATELISLLLMYFLSVYWMSSYGIYGVVMAHAFSHLVYFLVLVFLFRKTLFVKH